MPSPSPSAPSIDMTSFATLPTPRLHRLGPGSQKEVAFINYIDSRILQINRRYAKKFSADDGDGGEEVRGYDTFSQAAGDVERVLDAVWVSNTREYMYSFPVFIYSHGAPSSIDRCH